MLLVMAAYNKVCNSHVRHAHAVKCNSHMKHRMGETGMGKTGMGTPSTLHLAQ